MSHNVLFRDDGTVEGLIGPKRAGNLTHHDESHAMLPVYWIYNTHMLDLWQLCQRKYVFLVKNCMYLCNCMTFTVVILLSFTNQLLFCIRPYPTVYFSLNIHSSNIIPCLICLIICTSLQKGWSQDSTSFTSKMKQLFMLIQKPAFFKLSVRVKSDYTNDLAAQCEKEEEEDKGNIRVMYLWCVRNLTVECPPGIQLSTLY